MHIQWVGVVPESVTVTRCREKSSFWGPFGVLQSLGGLAFQQPGSLGASRAFTTDVMCKKPAGVVPVPSFGSQCRQRVARYKYLLFAQKLTVYAPHLV